MRRSSVLYGHQTFGEYGFRRTYQETEHEVYEYIDRQFQRRQPYS